MRWITEYFHNTEIPLNFRINFLIHFFHMHIAQQRSLPIASSGKGFKYQHFFHSQTLSFKKLRLFIWEREERWGVKIVLIFYDVLIFISIARFISHFLLTYISPMRAEEEEGNVHLSLYATAPHTFLNFHRNYYNRRRRVWMRKFRSWKYSIAKKKLAWNLSSPVKTN